MAENNKITEDFREDADPAYVNREDACTIPVLPKDQRVQFRDVDEAYEAGWQEAMNMVAMMSPADVVERPKWVDAKAQRPFAEYGESDSVLCGIGNEETNFIGCHRVLYFNGGVWCWPTGETYEGPKITHWMPLPAWMKELY